MLMRYCNRPQIYKFDLLKFKAYRETTINLIIHGGKMQFTIKFIKVTKLPNEAQKRVAISIYKIPKLHLTGTKGLKLLQLHLRTYLH